MQRFRHCNSTAAEASGPKITLAPPPGPTLMERKARRVLRPHQVERPFLNSRDTVKHTTGAH